MSKNDLNILVVEDNLGDFVLIDEMLSEARSFHKKVLNCTTLATATQNLAADKYDIVLLDLSLPDSSGIETFTRLNSASSQLPIIILSGYNDTDFAKEAVRLGAQDYLVKGEFDSKLLEKAISYSIERKLNLDILRKSELQYRSLVDTMNEGLLYVDNFDKVLFANNSYLKMVGYQLEEIIGKAAYEFLLNEEGGTLIKAKNLLRAKGISDSYEINLKKKSGEIIWVQISGAPVYDEKGEVIGSIGMHSDISERKTAEEKMKKQYVELQKTNEELDRFVYSASHDLRAPLTSIIGLINLMKRSTDDKDLIEYLTLMLQSITRLDRFIADIINYSRNSRLEVKKERISFMDMITEAIDTHKYIEGAGKIKITTDIDDKISYFSDSYRLRVIFNNLISNAIRYHNPDAETPFIHISIKVTESGCVIVVEDNGQGIEQEQIGKIFEMFYRASETSQGSGLGLYIVREKINKLKGSVEVESELGKGTKFTITLPNI
jgi:PAS domain S-box-containing protein